MNITPRNSPKAELPPRRAKRQQDGEEKTHKSVRKRQRRPDANIYGQDFGILPSDDSKVLASAVPDR